MGKLTTHVLDTAHGKPGANLALAVYRIADGQRTLLGKAITNDDGRCDAPLLDGAAFEAGTYEIEFAVGNYFDCDQKDTDIRFLDDVVIRFGIANADEHYHVPLLVSPFAYSTYRGS